MGFEVDTAALRQAHENLNACQKELGQLLGGRLQLTKEGISQAIQHDALDDAIRDLASQLEEGRRLTEQLGCYADVMGAIASLYRDAEDQVETESRRLLTNTTLTGNRSVAHYGEAWVDTSSSHPTYPGIFETSKMVGMNPKVRALYESVVQPL